MNLFSLSVAVSRAVLEERPASPVKVRAVEQLQETLAEEAERKPPVIQMEQQEAMLQFKKNIQDDWFLLLDVPTREASFAPPGTNFSSEFILYAAFC